MKTTRLLLPFLATLALADASRAEIKVGDAFPVIGDSAAQLAPSIQGKVAIVDFWASWCAPCKASFPAYGRMNADYAGKGLVILAVSVDEDPKSYSNFLKKYSPSFPVLLDRDHRLVSEVSVPTMPTCYVLDRSGQRYLDPRYQAPRRTQIAQEVELLLSEITRATCRPPQTMNRSPRTLLLFIAGMIAASLTGCSTVQAVRVQPWERGLLADSIIDPNRDPLGSAMMDHVTSSREAAAGGQGVGGAGCGCN